MNAIIYALLLLITIASNASTSEPVTKSPEAEFITNQGARFSYPKTWRVETKNDVVKLTGPEDDFFIYMLAEKETKNKRERAIDLWKKLKSQFPFPIFESLPLSNLWEWQSTIRFLFDIPTSIGVIFEAFAHTQNKITHWIFVEAKSAAYSRRNADFSVILDSFRTEHMKEPSYAGRPLKPLTQKNQKDFIDFLTSAMTKLQVPGSVFRAINKNGDVLFESALGVKHIDRKDPVTIDTPFMIGSVTKALTTLMMAKLVDQGNIGWETKIKDLLDGFKTGSDSLTNDLDIKTSVSASTGMPRTDMEFIFEYRGISSEDRIKELALMKPTTKYLETFQYSNHLVLVGGFAAAKAYAPKLSLESAFHKAMNDLVFTPLNMPNTSIKKYDADLVSGAFPHVVDLKNNVLVLPLDREESLYSTAPSGAAFSTLGDLSHYVELELNNGVFQNQRIISEDALLKRRERFVRVSRNIYYGLGLFIENLYGIKIIGHNGNTLGFTAALYFLPDYGIGIIVLANAQGANAFLNAALARFIELIFDLPKKAKKKLERVWREKNKIRALLAERVKTDSASVAWMKDWLGVYKNPRLGVIEIKSDEKGENFILSAGEWESPLGTGVSVSGGRSIIITAPPFFLEFIPDQSSSTLIMESNQDQFRFQKIK